MSERAIDKVLEIYFSKSARQDWEKTAAQEIQEKNPFEKLSWRGKDRIFYLPYFDAQDVADLQYLDSFKLPAAAQHPSGPRLWSNLPAVLVSNEGTANISALNHLSLGADGVLFDLRNFQQPDLPALLQNVQSPPATIAFYVTNEDSIVKSLSAIIEKKSNPDTVRGALFWESIPKNTRIWSSFRPFKNFKGLGFIIPPASPAEEISDALIKGVNIIDAFSAEPGHGDVFRSITFSLATDASLAESAAKLKALRMLWYQVMHAYGQHDFKDTDLVIHARSPKAPDGDFAPHENMLKGTFSAIAAITGGCDMLTIECDQEPSLVPRQARNISTILREESFLNRVADPFAGAYAFDFITNAIAEKAWAMFQEKCQRP